LPAWDIACAFQAAFSIVAAAERRRRTGQGAELRLALSDVAFSMLSHLGITGEAELLQQDRPAIGNYIYGAFGCDFGTADGQRVIVAAISSGQWAALVKACEVQPQMAALEQTLRLNFSREGDRYEAREAIAEVIDAWCNSRTYQQVRQAFDANRVCWGLYRTARGLLENDSRVGVANPIWERVATPGIGSHLSAATPVRAGNEDRTAAVPAPLLGQHTDEILQDVLGLDSPAVGRLHDAGVVAGPQRDPSLQVPRQD
jgi:2-methylfumaryl-CoA isomerase